MIYHKRPHIDISTLFRTRFWVPRPRDFINTWNWVDKYAIFHFSVIVSSRLQRMPMQTEPRKWSKCSPFKVHKNSLISPSYSNVAISFLLLYCRKPICFAHKDAEKLSTTVLQRMIIAKARIFMASATSKAAERTSDNSPLRWLAPKWYSPHG